MPIVFVHGVSVRNADAGAYAKKWRSLERFLRQYVAPVIAPRDPGGVMILDAYWGDLRGAFAWNRLSRPRSPLLGQGAESAAEAEQVIEIADMVSALRGIPRTKESEAAAAPSGLISPGSKPMAQMQPLRLKSFSPTQLSDLLASVSRQVNAPEIDQTMLAIAADEVANEPDTAVALQACRDATSELAVLEARIGSRYDALSGYGLRSQGGGRPFHDVLAETMRRIGDVPGFLATRIAAEFRRPMNDFISLFLADMLAYLDQRLGADKTPGPIPERVLSIAN